MTLPNNNHYNHGIKMPSATTIVAVI